MPKRIVLLVSAVCGLACALSVANAAKGPDFRDRLGTLETSLELDALGGLGGVTVDALGFVYVANFRDAVWRIDTDGQAEVLTRALYGASGNAVDSQGRLYQANFNAHTISRIERTGELSTFAKGFRGPVGIAIGPDDTLYVCNCTGNSLARVTPDGEVSEFATSDLFACPNGLVFGADEHLYVTSFNSHDIARVSMAGEVDRFTTVTGGAGNAHIAFANGYFYVTKFISNQIFKVAPDGAFELLAGTGQSGHDDGPALEGSLYRPNGIAADTTGNRLYVNTVVGKHGQPEPSLITLRTVDLVTLAEVLRAAIDDDRLDEVPEIYAQYKAARSKENTAAGMIAVAYNYLSARNTTAALTLFQLNAESYPENAGAQFHLGEAFRYTQQPDLALEQYRTVLALDPAHAKARSWINRLAGDSKIRGPGSGA